MRRLLALLFVLAGLVALAGCVPPDNDDDDDDDSTETPLEPAPRRVLHEVFSGSNCGPCNSADARILEILEANPGRHVLLAYHVGSDPYMTFESVGRKMWYLPGESGYSIPWLHADGVNGLHPNLTNDGEGYLQSDFDGFAAVPAPLDIQVSHSITDQTVNYSLTLLPTEDVPSEELVLHVAIIEGVTYNNVGTNGQTEFHHVMKKMVPDDEGTGIDPLVAGEDVSFSGSYTFQGDYVSGTGVGNLVNHSIEHTVEEFDDLSVVVFVQDRESWAVHQSAWSGEHSSE
ncbi:MAG: hypothetical protein VX498_05070 [Myxococcota bacterium]|nr:hypothetical protein [Myxococcota bacterium]